MRNLHSKEINDSALDDPEDHLEIKSDVVVLAAGSWCPYLGELAGVSIPVVPVLGLMWSTSIQETKPHS